MVNDRPIPATAGKSLLNVLINADVLIATACGGQGSCHLCRVTVRSGCDNLPPANAMEVRALGNLRVAKGMRLACQVVVDQPIDIIVPLPRNSSGGGSP